MPLPRFQIVLDSPTNSFYAGTNLTGRVHLNLDKPKKVRALRLKIEGKAKVGWEGTESHREPDGKVQDRSISFNATEEYISNKFNLAGGNEIEIPAGEHVYPFTAAIPPNCPSSYSGEHGSVDYEIVATLDRPWKMDHETKLKFFVVAPKDLNFNNAAKEPVQLEKSKKFCCLFCASGPLTLTVRLPHAGYTPGQTIHLSIDCENGSNVTIENLKVKLKKEMVWTAHHPNKDTKSNTVEMAAISLPGVTSNSSSSYNEQMVIPSDTYANLDACSIIKISYYLRVDACPEGCHSDLEVKLPIIMGSVPIYSGDAPAGYVPQPPIEAGQNIPAYAQGGYPTGPGFAVSPSGGGPPPVGFVGDVAPSAPSAPLESGVPYPTYPTLPTQPAYNPNPYSAPAPAPSYPGPYPAAPGANPYGGPAAPPGVTVHPTVEGGAGEPSAASPLLDGLKNLRPILSTSRTFRSYD